MSSRLQLDVWTSVWEVPSGEHLRGKGRHWCNCTCWKFSVDTLCDVCTADEQSVIAKLLVMCYGVLWCYCFVPREAKFWGRPQYFCCHSFGPTGIYKHLKGDIKIFTHYIVVIQQCTVFKQHISKSTLLHLLLPHDAMRQMTRIWYNIELYLPWEIGSPILHVMHGLSNSAIFKYLERPLP